MAGDGPFGGFGVDRFAGAVELMPVKKHGWKGGQKTLGNFVLISMGFLRLEAAEHGAAGAEDIHGVGFRRNCLKRSL